VRERDPEALSELFEAHFDRIYALAHRLLGEGTLAEDAAQDVFMKVYRAADQIDPTRDPGPWLVAITYNVCREYWRSRGYKLSRQSRSLDQDAAVGDSLASPDRGPEVERLRAERERLLAEALRRLPEPQRAVIILHDYQGLEHEEIARIVGSGHAAVRKRYSRAIAQLRKMLDGLWP
jgi:RNA polymerase sigma-70 factor (ECF subfamily)